jgi:ATP-binding cassette, subfamily B, bacterial PglK
LSNFKKIKQYVKEISFLLEGRVSKVIKLWSLFLISSMLDLVGIGLIGTYISIIVTDNVAAIDQISALLPFWDFSSDRRELIRFIGMLILLLTLFKVIFAIVINWSILNFCYQEGVRLRNALMESFQRMAYSHYINRMSSEFVYHAGLAASFSQDILQSILRLLSACTVGLVIIIFLGIQDIQVLTILLLMFLIVGTAFDMLFRKQVSYLGKKTNTASRLVIQSVSDALKGFKEIRVLAIERFFSEKFGNAAQNYATAGTQLGLITSIPRYLLELTIIGFVVIVVFLFYVPKGAGTEALVTTLSMFGVAALRLIPFVNQTVTGITKLRAGRHGVRLLYRDLNAQSKNARAEETPTTKIEFGKKFESYEFKDLWFRYGENQPYVLRSANFSVRAGEAIGIVGQSGAGKTTLVDIILGLLAPESGSIFLNGREINRKLIEWRDKVAYLPQDTFLIDGSIAENIALGTGAGKKYRQQVISAAHHARLLTAISRMPDGLDTLVGDGGIKLSGGQKQRVALARAFFFNRQVLVLDESTSALDNETEREIIDEIKELKGTKTLLLISHRLSVLEHCDCIYRLESGQLVRTSSASERLRDS